MSGSFTEVRAAEVFQWVRQNAPREADAVFVGGNGLRAIGAIDALERALSRALRARHADPDRGRDREPEPAHRRAHEPERRPRGDPRVQLRLAGRRLLEHDRVTR